MQLSSFDELTNRSKTNPTFKKVMGGPGRIGTAHDELEEKLLVKHENECNAQTTTLESRVIVSPRASFQGWQSRQTEEKHLARDSLKQ